MIAKHPERTYRLDAFITTNISKRQLEDFMQILGFHSYRLEEETEYKLRLAQEKVKELEKKGAP